MITNPPAPCFSNIFYPIVRLLNLRPQVYVAFIRNSVVCKHLDSCSSYLLPNKLNNWAKNKVSGESCIQIYVYGNPSSVALHRDLDLIPDFPLPYRPSHSVVCIHKNGCVVRTVPGVRSLVRRISLWILIFFCLHLNHRDLLLVVTSCVLTPSLLPFQKMLWKWIQR